MKFTNGTVSGILIDGVLHLCRKSESKYHLVRGEEAHQYACLCSHCDRGVQDDMREVVLAGKAAGATAVALRVSKDIASYAPTEIEGLIVWDPQKWVNEEVGNGWLVQRGCIIHGSSRYLPLEPEIDAIYHAQDQRVKQE